MVSSMTGYGRGETLSGGRNIAFEIRSVNHKFFDFNAKLPRSCLFLEDRLKTYVQGRVARGKVDVFLQMETVADLGTQVVVNHALAAAYARAFEELQETFSLSDGPTLALLSRCPDVLTVQKAPENEDALWAAVLEAVTPAVDSFVKMRETEGEKLRQDVLEKAARIDELVEQVEKTTPETVERYRERLKEKIEELLGSDRYDEQRVLTEVAVFADKVTVDEETVRLKSHLSQLRGLLQSGGPIGRKLDFLVQEMNREANTIGSKSQSADAAHLVVDIKSEIEKIREQIQNIE